MVNRNAKLQAKAKRKKIRRESSKKDGPSFFQFTQLFKDLMEEHATQELLNSKK